MPEKVIEYREIVEVEVDLRGFVAEVDSSRDGTTAYEFVAGQHSNRTAEFVGSEFAEYSDTDGTWGGRFARRLWRRRGNVLVGGGLLADRVASDGAFFEGSRFCWRRFGTTRIFTRARRRKCLGWGRWCRPAEHRRAAKVINFGIIYGLSPFGLAQQLGIPQKEAAQFITAYFARYRGVKKYLDNVAGRDAEDGVAKTLFGRIRPIPEINSPQIQLRNFAERTALNSPLQGTAADLIKMAMITIDRTAEEGKVRSKDDFAGARRTVVRGAGSAKRRNWPSSSRKRWRACTSWRCRWWWKLESARIGVIWKTSRMRPDAKQVEPTLVVSVRLLRA